MPQRQELLDQCRELCEEVEVHPYTLAASLAGWGRWAWELPVRPSLWSLFTGVRGIGILREVHGVDRFCGRVLREEQAYQKQVDKCEGAAYQEEDRL